MANGFLKTQEDGSIVGKIVTLAMNLQIKLKPILAADRRTNGPTHIVLAKGSDGNGIEVGAAWEKLTKEKVKFYSISLDDPSFPQKLNVTAFWRDDQYEIVWERPKQKQQSEAA